MSKASKKASSKSPNNRGYTAKDFEFMAFDLVAQGLASPIILDRDGLYEWNKRISRKKRTPSREVAELGVMTNDSK